MIRVEIQIKLSGIGIPIGCVLRGHSPNFVGELLEFSKFVAEMNAKIGFAGSNLI